MEKYKVTMTAGAARRVSKALQDYAASRIEGGFSWASTLPHINLATYINGRNDWNVYELTARELAIYAMALHHAIVSTNDISDKIIYRNLQRLVYGHLKDTTPTFPFNKYFV